MPGQCQMLATESEGVVLVESSPIVVEITFTFIATAAT